MSPKQKKAICIVGGILLLSIISFFYLCNSTKDNFLETYTYVDEATELSTEELAQVEVENESLTQIIENVSQENESNTEELFIENGSERIE